MDCKCKCDKNGQNVNRQEVDSEDDVYLPIQSVDAAVMNNGKTLLIFRVLSYPMDQECS